MSIYARPPSEQPTLRTDLQALQPDGGARWASVEWGLGLSHALSFTNDLRHRYTYCTDHLPPPPGMFWAPEGLKRGTAPAWVAAYNATLSFGDCRLLAFYNWNPGSPNVSLIAARQMLADWRPPRVEVKAKAERL